MGAHNANDQRVKVFHKRAGGGLIALADALQTASKVKGR
jgi:hypothetical protein